MIMTKGFPRVRNKGDREHVSWRICMQGPECLCGYSIASIWVTFFCPFRPLCVEKQLHSTTTAAIGNQVDSVAFVSILKVLHGGGKK